MKIAIGSDHAGYQTKEFIKAELFSHGIEFQDFGTIDESSVDYPDIVHPLANDVQSGSYQYGILLCGTGNGMAITANKYTGIRAALCWNEEITRLARQHNDANILSLPARFLTPEDAVNLCLIFLETEFEGGRHQVRIEKISTTINETP